MLKVVVGSKSAIKVRAIQAALEALGETSEIQSVEVDSGVPNQPRGWDELSKGAFNRAWGALRECKDAEIGIGIENGIISVDGLLCRWQGKKVSRLKMGGTKQMYDPPCVAVISRRLGGPFFGFGAFLAIPHWMMDRVIEENTELGHIVQSVAGGGEKDPHKWLSDGALPRDEVLKQAIICALLPVLRSETKYKAKYKT